jgi:hypothetical protein
MGQRLLWTLYSTWTGMKFPMYLMMYVHLNSSQGLGADKKDLLQSLQSYSSRYYTANNLLLEPYKRIRNQRQSGGDIRSMSRTTTPRREIEEIPDESGSEYGSNQAAGGDNNDREEENGNGDGVDVSEVEMGPRKRGGQRGKRKLKDMYLALDGSALLTLGLSSLHHISLS